VSLRVVLARHESLDVRAGRVTADTEALFEAHAPVAPHIQPRCYARHLLCHCVRSRPIVTWVTRLSASRGGVQAPASRTASPTGQQQPKPKLEPRPQQKPAQPHNHSLKEPLASTLEEPRRQSLEQTLRLSPQRLLAALLQVSLEPKPETKPGASLHESCLQPKSAKPLRRPPGGLETV